MTWKVPYTIVLLCAAVIAPHATAHEKWYFQGDRPNFNPSDIAEPLTLALLAAAAAFTGGAAWWQRRRGGRDLVPGPSLAGASGARMAIFYGMVPAILGAHLAVPLLVNGSAGNLFSPNNSLGGAHMYWTGVVQTGIAIALFYGALARVAAVLLAALWAASVLIIGPEPTLENIHYLGFALFFFFCGRGPLAIDRLLFPRLEPSARLAPFGFRALRVGVGASLLIVALTEKLMNLELAERFLDQYPLNFTPFTDRAFAQCAGVVEAFIGIWIMLGIFPRFVVLVAWLPFNLTLTVFDWQELVGHLPFYGFFAVTLFRADAPNDAALLERGLREAIAPVQSKIAP